MAETDAMNFTQKVHNSDRFWG